MNWNQEEFIAYLLIYASYADGVFLPSERQLILEKINNDSFHKIMSESAGDSDEVKIEKIKAHEGIYYPTHAQKQELLYLIKKQFLADGNFSDEEKVLWDRLVEIL